VLAGFSERQTPSLKKDITARLTKLLHDPFPVSRALASGERGCEQDQEDDVDSHMSSHGHVDAPCSPRG